MRPHPHRAAQVRVHVLVSVGRRVCVYTCVRLCTRVSARCLKGSLACARSLAGLVGWRVPPSPAQTPILSRTQHAACFLSEPGPGRLGKLLSLKPFESWTSPWPRSRIASLTSFLDANVIKSFTQFISIMLESRECIMPSA